VRLPAAGSMPSVRTARPTGTLPPPGLQAVPTPPPPRPVTAPAVPPIVPSPDSIPGTVQAADLLGDDGDNDNDMPDPRPMAMEWDEVEPTTVSKGLLSFPPAADSFDSEEEVTRVRQDEPMPGFGAGFRSDAITPVSEPPKSSGWHEATSRPPGWASPRSRAADSFRRIRFDPALQVRLIAAVVGVLVVFAVVLYWSHDRGVATVRLTTDPRDAVVRLDGQRVPSTASPFVLSNLEAAEEHTVSVEKPGYESWSAQLKLRPDQVLDLPLIKLESANPVSGAAPLAAPSLPPAALMPSPPASSAVAPASSSSPAVAPPADGAVSVEPQNSRPAAQSGIRTAAVSARVTRAAALAPRDKRAAKPATAKRADAAPAARSGGLGTLRVNSRPWSRVIVDGRLIGNTPQMAIPLRAGTHRLKLVNPEFGIDKTLTVDIKPGEITTRVVALQ
jgi:hypothetical protein